MTDARKGQGTTSPGQRDQQTQQPIKDLDIRKDDVEKVKGGRRLISDPCEGGE